MQHTIPVERYGPQGENMAEAVGSCVHCGFCLPTCPTYVTMGEEMDSPRGRIFLMKEVLEGELELEAALPFIDNCLGCQACQTACPSGVEYGELIIPFRAYAEEHRTDRSPLDRIQREMVLRTLPFPTRFRLAARFGRFGRPFARFMPEQLGAMLRLLPDRLPAKQPLPEVHPAEGERRGRVALLAGCAQQVLEPDIGWATLRVLARNGIETVIPSGQVCCGSLAMHTGASEQARPLALRNLAWFPEDVDAIVTNAAGCGSGMKDYGLLLKGTPWQEQAESFADRVVDVSDYLDEIGLADTAGPGAPRLAAATKVAYHDACHLVHAQGIHSAPRALLESIVNLELVEPDEWEICCGSAGTYNVEKPDTAAELGRRKAGNLVATGAQTIATGNIGCMTQVRNHLSALGREIEVLHTVQLLDRAYARGA